MMVTRVQVPAPSPSRSVRTAPDFDTAVREAFQDIDRYLFQVCPAIASSPVLFSEMAKRAKAGDLVVGMTELEIRIDNLIRTKADLETILEAVSKWEMTVKGIIRAIAIAKAKAEAGRG